MKDLNYCYWTRHRTPSRMESIENMHGAIVSILKQDVKMQKLKTAVASIAPLLLAYIDTDVKPEEKTLVSILQSDDKVFSTIREDAYAFCESAFDFTITRGYNHKEEDKLGQTLELWYYLFAEYLNEDKTRITRKVLEWAEMHWHLEAFDILELPDDLVKSIVDSIDGESILSEFMSRADIDRIIEKQKDDSFEAWEDLARVTHYIDIPEDISYQSFYASYKGNVALMVDIFRRMKFVCLQTSLLLHSCNADFLEQLMLDETVTGNKVNVFVLLDAWYYNIKTEYSGLLLYEESQGDKDSIREGNKLLTELTEALSERVKEMIEHVIEKLGGSKDLYLWYFTRNYYREDAFETLDKKAENFIRGTIEHNMRALLRIEDIRPDIGKQGYLQFVSSDYTKLEALGQEGYDNLFEAYNSFLFSKDYYVVMALDTMCVSLFRGFALAFWKQGGDYVARADELMDKVQVPYEGWKLRMGGETHRLMNREAFVLSSLIMLQEFDEILPATLNTLRERVINRLMIQVHACWYDTLDSSYLVPLKLAETLLSQFETTTTCKNYELRLIDAVGNLELICKILELNNNGLTDDVKTRLSSLWNDQSEVLKIKYEQMHCAGNYRLLENMVKQLIK